MKCGGRIALGLAGGYLLGRKRNGRMLLLLGAALASRNLAGAAARRGTDSLTSSPQVAGLIDQGREAMVAMLSSRIESLTDQLHSRTEALRRPGMPGGEEAEEPEQPEPPSDEEEDEYEGAESPESPEADEAEEEYEQDEEAEESPEEEESEPEPARQRRRPRESPARQRAAQSSGRTTQGRRRAPAGQSRR